MHREHSLCDRVQGRLERQEYGGESGEEGQVSPDTRPIGLVPPPPKTRGIETGHEQRTERDFGCQVPGRPWILAWLQQAMR